MAKIGRTLAALGERRDELVESAGAQELRGVLVDLEAWAIRGAGVSASPGEVGRLVAVDQNQLDIEELEAEGRAMRAHS